MRRRNNNKRIRQQPGNTKVLLINKYWSKELKQLVDFNGLVNSLDCQPYKALVNGLLSINEAISKNWSKWLKLQTICLQYVGLAICSLNVICVAFHCTGSLLWNYWCLEISDNIIWFTKSSSIKLDIWSF